MGTNPRGYDHVAQVWFAHTMDELEPLAPDEAVELYLDHRRREVSDATMVSHKSRLGHFIRWCEQEGIDNMNEMTGRTLHQFQLWRRTSNGGINPVTEKTQMETFRVFIRFVESIDGIRPGSSEKVQSPDLKDKENIRDVMLDRDRVEEILDHLAKYEYAPRAHVILALEWHTMMRRGAVRALDVSDYDSEGQFIELRHRPETDYPD